MHFSTTITTLLAFSSAALAHPRFWKPGFGNNGNLFNKRQGMSTSVGTEYVTIGGFTAPRLTTQFITLQNPSTTPSSTSSPVSANAPPPPPPVPVTSFATSCGWAWYQNQECKTIATTVVTPAAPSPKKRIANPEPQVLVVTVMDITTVYESSTSTASVPSTTLAAVSVPSSVSSFTTSKSMRATSSAQSTSSTAPTSPSAPASAANTATPASPAAPSGSLDPSVIIAIAPNSSSCADADPNYPSECATASQAAPHVAAGWAKWNITSKGAQAAALALMLFESGGFLYNVAHFNNPPPGKGTRNMQSPTFNVKYAATLFGSNASSDPATALNSVLPDEYTFASASWFLATQCPDVLRQFATDPDGAWTAYLGPNCIGTTDTSQRDAGWTAAKKAMGVGS